MNTHYCVALRTIQSKWSGGKARVYLDEASFHVAKNSIGEFFFLVLKCFNTIFPSFLISREIKVCSSRNSLLKAWFVSYWAMLTCLRTRKIAVESFLARADKINGFHSSSLNIFQKSIIYLSTRSTWIHS